MREKGGRVVARERCFFTRGKELRETYEQRKGNY